MTSVAPDTELLQGLDEEMRQAWTAYNDRLRELSGEEYELAESESWDELQVELRRLDDQRESLAPAAPPD